ncbi:stage II sporulation protein P [Clostridium sp. KNHs214]|uniref:stage II sporulation protein P n=1 Tax=Clostridium sp. KNHs214 TaxID=1540257 RepID=UPI0005545369|nr:stage II sporulation protein P [Clostridium sp. KNHs214]
MKKIYKNIAILTSAFTLIAGFAYSTIDSKKSAAATKYEPTKIDNKNLASNRISKSAKSSNVLIYTSQPDEKYVTGKKTTDIGNLLSSKLNEKGMNSDFINNKITKEALEPNKKYISYHGVVRKFVTQNVKDYNNSILLNIRRNDFPEEDIVIALVKNNPHYAENKKFADSLVEQFNKLGQRVRINYYGGNNNSLNQDLSNQSISLAIGNNQSNDSELNKTVDAIATALQNVQDK